MKKLLIIRRKECEVAEATVRFCSVLSTESESIESKVKYVAHPASFFLEVDPGTEIALLKKQ